jgi:nucleoporin NUP82
VVAVAIPSDVYLTYSIFILTSVMRLTVFPLNLQADSPPAPSPSILPKESSTEPVPEDHRLQSRWLKPVDGPPSYVSLLTETPYKVPAILKPSGLPPLPKLSLPSSSSSEFMLTPDTLRYIGKTIEQISGQIHELYIAQRAAEARASLQKNEQSRQANKCREMQGILGKLKEKGTARTEERLKQVEETQKGIMKRLDRMLQSLMEKASPELSEHEKKWFEELKRMKVEVLGQGRYDEGSLATRVKAVSRISILVRFSILTDYSAAGTRLYAAHALLEGLGG